jgi:putative phosphoribosyl transferase
MPTVGQDRIIRRFRDRTEAGQLLAEKLGQYANRKEVLVSALPRGGVPVAFEVGNALSTPLDIFVVRKLGVPGNEELAMGAIATGGVRVLNYDVIRAAGISDDVIDFVTAREQVELKRRELAYRGDFPVPEISGRIVILVDDGIATGSTMRAAIGAVRQQNPVRIVVAVPTAPPSSCNELRSEVEEVVSLMTPEPFYAVGQWYEIFDQISDEEARDLFERAKRRLQERGIRASGN